VQNSSIYMIELSQFTAHSLWDLMDDVSFWIKDTQGKFVWVNLTLAQQAQASRESIIGTRDSDWFFNELASVYMEDDALVIRSGTPILNKPELVMSVNAGVEWRMTSKFAVRDQAQRIVGTYGMSRPMEGGGSLPTDYADLAEIVAYVRTGIKAGISVDSLARSAHLSVATLERHVRRHLRMTPQALIQRIRMNRARHLLTSTTLKVGEIALECGYESFSSFSRAFRKTYGCAPGKMRNGDLLE